MKKPGAKAIITHEGKILLVLRDNTPTIAYPNKWNLPGGGIEDGESPTAAMTRELEEEIGLKNPDLVYAGTTTYTDKSLVHRFFCEVTHPQFKTITLLSEGQRLQWFTLDEALDLIDQDGYSPYFAVYLKMFTEDIRSFLNGTHSIVPTDTDLSVIVD